MTKWKEEFDGIYLYGVDKNQNKAQIQHFISNLIEQVIEDIPDEHNGKIYAKPDRLRNWFDLKELKQQLRDKYLN